MADISKRQAKVILKEYLSRKLNSYFVRQVVGANSVFLPDELRRALLRLGITHTAFLNQLMLAEGGYTKLKKVAKHTEYLYSVVLARIKEDPHLFAKVKHTIEYYKEWKKTGNLPMKLFRTHVFTGGTTESNPQILVSNIIIETLHEKINTLVSAHNSTYDMCAGIKGFANCFILSTYYLVIARRFGLNVDLYTVPNHTIIGLNFGNSVYFLDPPLNQTHVALKLTYFNKRGAIVDKADSTLEVDYREPKKMKYYGLQFAWCNKILSYLDAAMSNKVSEKQRRDLLETAEDAAQSLVEFDPSFIISLCCLAEVYYRYYLFETDVKNRRAYLVKAGRVLDGALMLEPTFMPALDSSGDVYFSLGELEQDRTKKENFFERARQNYSKILDIDRERGEVWLKLGFVLIELGEEKRYELAFNEVDSRFKSIMQNICP